MIILIGQHRSVDMQNKIQLVEIFYEAESY